MCGAEAATEAAGSGSGAGRGQQAGPGRGHGSPRGGAAGARAGGSGAGPAKGTPFRARLTRSSPGPQHGLGSVTSGFLRQDLVQTGRDQKGQLVSSLDFREGCQGLMRTRSSSRTCWEKASRSLSQDF